MITVHVTVDPRRPGPGVTHCGLHFPQFGSARSLELINIAGGLKPGQRLCRRCAAAIRPEFVAEILKDRAPIDGPDVEETLP